MNLCVNPNIENWLSIISLIFAATGGVFIFLQWKKSIKNRRAEFIYQILEKLRFDNNLSTTMYTIEYNLNWYDGNFHNSDLEKSVDILFSYLDYVCYLKTTGNISKTEYNIFQYEIHRVCNSLSSNKYLWNLFHFAKKNNSTCTFQYLIDYGIECELMSKDFKSNETLYDKTLNW